MPKLAIYIPKKDMRAIEKWRKQINFSQVFMRALMQEIRRRSVAAPNNKLAAAAQYYQSKLAESSDSLIEYGHQMGTSHVLDCGLPPELIRRLLDIRAAGTVRREDFSVIEQAIGTQMIQIQDFAEKSGFDDGSHPTWRSSIYEGYVEGVAAAWKRVCEEMSSR